MPKILILGRNYHPDGKETATEIHAGLTESAKNEAEFSVIYYKNLVFDISNQNIKVWDAVSGVDLKEFDSVLMTNWFSHASVRKDMALALALYFQHHGISVFNSEALHNRSSSKLSQMMLAALNNVPIARSLFSLSFEQLVKTAQNTPKLKLPLIFKDAQASRGKGNYLVKAWSEAENLAPEHNEKHPFMVQEFIESDGSDYRFFVAGGHSQFVIHRLGSDDSHLTNTSAGASTEILQTNQLPVSYSHDVETMSKLLGREVTGIDIMEDEAGKHYFLEANPIPQIATGSNVELKLTALKNALIKAAQERSHE